MSQEITNCNCPGCQQPLDYYEGAKHPKDPRPATMYGTCRNPDCAFFENTDSDAAWGVFAQDTQAQAKYAVAIQILKDKHALDVVRFHYE